MGNERPGRPPKEARRPWLLTQAESGACALEVSRGHMFRRDALVKKRLLTRETFSTAIAFFARVPTLDLDTATIDPKAARSIPMARSRQFRTERGGQVVPTRLQN